MQNDMYGSIAPYDSRALPIDNVYQNQGYNFGSQFFTILPYIEEEPLYKSARYTPLPPATQEKAYAVTQVIGSAGSVPVNYHPAVVPACADFLIPFNTVNANTNLVLAQVIKPYLCPSDPSAQRDMAPNGWGGASYGCNFLVFGNPALGNVNDPDGLGGSQSKGAWAQKITLADSFPDGRAFTILFAEKYLSCNIGTTGTAWAWPNHNSSFAPAVAMESPWNDGTRFQVLPPPEQCVSQYAQTGHRDGMNVVMADGSGRSLSPKISALTYQHAMQPNDGVQLGSDW
jgi:prepilin-type processing-associated H-X9-DG protein